MKKLKIYSGLLVIMVVAIVLSIYYNDKASASIKHTTISMTANPSTIKANNSELSVITAFLPCASGNKENIGKAVDFTTNIGVLSSSTAFTDNSCKATVRINSAQTGVANVAASTKSGTGEIAIYFANP